MTRSPKSCRLPQPATSPVPIPPRTATNNYFDCARYREIGRAEDEHPDERFNAPPCRQHLCSQDCEANDLDGAVPLKLTCLRRESEKKRGDVYPYEEGDHQQCYQQGPRNSLFLSDQPREKCQPASDKGQITGEQRQLVNLVRRQIFEPIV